MAIPEPQLESWSRLGAHARLQGTYQSIRDALSAHPWPAPMEPPAIYLQGSYRNRTNISGDSDVDIVVETSRVFYHDLAPHESAARRILPAQFTWEQFRDEVYRALASHYTATTVRLGNKCIHVGGAGERLNADVVPCCEYRAYRRNEARGIAFWTLSRHQVINYPHQHYENGVRKNTECGDNYKPMIRVFKNARNAAGSDFPSYFLECLLYNVTDYRCTGSYEAKFAWLLAELLTAKANGSMRSWACQNGEQSIFGNATHQIEIGAAERFVEALAALWRNWQ